MTFLWNLIKSGKRCVISANPGKKLTFLWDLMRNDISVEFYKSNDITVRSDIEEVTFSWSPMEEMAYCVIR